MGTKIFIDMDGYEVLTIKVPKKHRIALEKLCRMIGEPMSPIIRRLLREELYYRGLIDDELL